VNQDELASQLSAMFDGELPAAECELLSRRLARDEQLRATWSRYAVIGAALRAEPLAQVRPDFARRVSAALAGTAAAPVRLRRMGFLRGAALGSAVAAGVAGGAIMLLRHDLPVQVVQVAGTAPAVTRAAAVPTQVAAYVAGPRIEGATGGSVIDRQHSYTVPPFTYDNNVALQGSIADYVLEHSEYSSPFTRGNLLANMMGNEQVLPMQPSAMAPATKADAGQ
jgi:sigma-E factor negative regulatory protein RseA